VPANHPIPSASGVRAILADLLGREVSVTPGSPLALERDTPAIVADYESDEGPLGVVVLSDLQLSNSLGAALTMVPPSAVAEAVKKWQIDDANVENLREVVNIMTRLFNCDDTPHLRFRTVHRLPGDDLPEETRAVVDEPRARRDLDVFVEEYGTGKLAILSN
jgi:hypothetical protein